MKITNEMIKKAYAEFNSDRDMVSSDSFEIIAYDFLTQNMKVTDFLQHRRIYLPHLCICIGRLFPATDQNERLEQVKKYCQKNKINFNKYNSIDFLFMLNENKFRKCNVSNENYVVCVENTDTSSINNEKLERIIKDLAGKIQLSKECDKYFGIVEYYSYYDIPIEVLKTYLSYVCSYNDEHLIVSQFIEKLELSDQIEKVDVKVKARVRTI